MANVHGRAISSFMGPLNQQLTTPHKNMDKMIFYMPRNEEIYHENNLIENKHRFNVISGK